MTRMLIGSLCALLASGAAYGVLETQEFANEGAATTAGWTGSGNREAGSDYGFSDSNNAGVAAGEMGGQIEAPGAGLHNYYADLTIGDPDPSTQDLHATGTFVMTEVASGWEGGDYVYFLDTEFPTQSHVLGFQMNDAFDPVRSRMTPLINGANGRARLSPIYVEMGTVARWTIDWDADGGDAEGAGRYTVTVVNAATEELFGEGSLDYDFLGQTIFDGFGMGRKSQDATDTWAKMYYDDLEYGIVGGAVVCNPGDADDDGDVDDDDLSLLLANWGSETATCAEGEFSETPPVNDDDLSLLLANWTGPLVAAVPEPTTMVLLAAGAAVLLRHRKA